MPAENLEIEGLEKIPDLSLAQNVFRAHIDKDEDATKHVMEVIISGNMTPYYKQVCGELGVVPDDALIAKMEAENTKQLAELDEKIRVVTENEGETEVRDAKMAKAHYLSRIGEKTATVTLLNEIYEKTVMLGYRLDLLFHLIRIGFFFQDTDLISRNLDRAQTLIDAGGDWDRRNRLKVYKGLFRMSVRDFKEAAKLMLDAVATFTSYELMEYSTFIAYTIICAMISEKRPELRDKVVKGPEINEALHKIPSIRQLLTSFYECDYAEFFKYLAGLESLLQHDRYLAQHTRYYVREMRVLAYQQQLDSYSSLELASMARQFGVSVEFIDQEMSRFIAAGRLSAKIDKVGGVVETNRPDSKNYQYQAVIKHGDILLNRVQKLSRIINM